MPVDSDPIRSLRAAASDLAYLQLLHLADSALPIGALAHSFGIESLVSNELLNVGELEDFFSGFLEEAGVVEAVFCREAFRLSNGRATNFPMDCWRAINERLSALKPARETRAGSAALGRNLLAAVAALGNFPMVREALSVALSDRGMTTIEHSPALGLVGGALHLDEDTIILAYLHQSVASLVSACQRLLPLGQSEAARILWTLKPKMIEAAVRSSELSVDDACCFIPLLDWGAMEHPALGTRLFVS